MSRVRIVLRRDTAAAWTAANPVLESGEAGVETDTLRIKIGNGFSNWQALPYYDSVQRSDAAPAAVGTAAAGVSALVSRADHSHALPSDVACATLATSGNATVGGALTVTGALVGGTHSHTSAAISDFAAAVATRVGQLLQGDATISVVFPNGQGGVTLSVTGPLDGGTFTGAPV